MLTIYLNKKLVTLKSTVSLADFLQQQGYTNQAVAIMLNHTFVAKSKHATVQLQDQDRIDIVTPMQGG